MTNGWELSWRGIPVSQYRCRRPMWLSVYSFLSLHHPMLINMGKIYPISSICFSSFIADRFHWGVRPTNYKREEKYIPNANHTFLLIWAYRVCGNLSLCLHIWCLRWSDFLWICANIQNKTKTGVCFENGVLWYSLQFQCFDNINLLFFTKNYIIFIAVFTQTTIIL